MGLEWGEGFSGVREDLSEEIIFWDETWKTKEASRLEVWGRTITVQRDNACKVPASRMSLDARGKKEGQAGKIKGDCHEVGGDQIFVGHG